jgi:hypothetical protein
MHRLALLAALLLGGCTERVERDADPTVFFRNLFGAHLDGRERPPGLDQPFPNLASVPPRPVPPSLAARAALSEALAADRERAATPRDEQPAAAAREADRAPRMGGESPPPSPRLAAAPAPAPATRPATTPGGTPPAAAPTLPSALGFGAPPPAPDASLLAPRTN